MSARPLPCWPEYVIERTLKGGMGEVHLCLNPQTGDRIAAKTLLVEKSTSAEARQRFQNEASLWIQLPRHPYVTKALAVREHEGILYLMSEWIDGGSLQDVLDSERMTRSPLGVAGFIHQAAAGMAHVWRGTGLIHRDLKPGNILMRRTRGEMCKKLNDWDPKISDFGIALLRSTPALGADFGRDHIRIMEPSGQITAAGRALGTPLYMPPEQWTAASCVTPAADVYAFGVITYQLLTGRHPFPAESVLQMRYAQMSSSPVPPSEHDRDVPPWLNDLVLQTLQPDPARRPADCQVLADTLMKGIESGAHVEKVKLPVPVALRIRKALDDTDALTEQAYSLMQAGDFRNAHEKALEALAHSPMKGDNHHLYAKILMTVGDLPGALEAYHRMRFLAQHGLLLGDASDVSTCDSDAALGIASVLLSMRREVEALELLRALTPVPTRLARQALLTSRALNNLGRIQEAWDALEPDLLSLGVSGQRIPPGVEADFLKVGALILANCDVLKTPPPDLLKRIRDRNPKVAARLLVESHRVK